ncbi:uncharacterized protein Z518_02212 [Rhinocladiella mackenziei CBS 650.93]|uniref:Rhinocladiella mackenziei CBS 650.93 unplaced genomic scaffold supercont1.2, whole genome shotgun sequence n=1 Tax=Rhinocladiella mackenziei CBS 650.93 TaxID=1442369 RepID=A0A0D2IP17_9EURO|nr:uncharacterized protein Z518_02212 [Rhinocladiella mackenziei CBS 650.93]KIX07559.1 hypothetical protein Z518_02212 [Rhinocladiella mackenziei CBS 650.93]
MAEQALGLTLNAVPIIVKHGDKVWDPIQHRYKKMREQLPREDSHVYDSRTMEEKGLHLRRRRDVASDEEIVEVVRHKGENLPRRPNHRGSPRRSRSVNNSRAMGASAAAGAGTAALVRYRDRRDDYSDSEGSIPPRSRVRPKSTSGRSRRRRSSSSSSSSSSSLMSSTEEEKNCRKLQRKKWITAALASVATIHAASKIYSSIESHDKRREKVREGKLSPEDAHKQQRASRWQDAAAIGIAALGIKGAVSEWNEVSEEHSQHKEMLLLREEHHKQRLERERRRRARERGGYYKGRDGHWYYDGPTPQSSESYRGSGVGTRYDDSNLIKDSDRERRMIEDEEDDRKDKSRRAVSHGRGDGR